MGAEIGGAVACSSLTVVSVTNLQLFPANESQIVFGRLDISAASIAGMESRRRPWYSSGKAIGAALPRSFHRGWSHPWLTPATSRCWLSGLDSGAMPKVRLNKLEIERLSLQLVRGSAYS
jgi:hypothetical protein